MATASRRSLVTLVAISILFFCITGTTFTSLGVALPTMVADLHLHWKDAGMGFSLMGVVCGSTSYLPAWLIRRIGVRWTLGLGSVAMMAGFLCMATVRGTGLYSLAACVLGLGFTLLGAIPGTYVLTRCFVQPSLAIGIYLAVGSLGSVVAPLAFPTFLAITGSWRLYWLTVAIAVAISSLIAIGVVDISRDIDHATSAPIAHRGRMPWAEQDWGLLDALRTLQFSVIAVAYMMILLCTTSLNSIFVAHLVQRGASAYLAGSILSLEALINTVVRTAGGVLGSRAEPKWMAVLSLLTLTVALTALIGAHSVSAMLVYAVGAGIGFGLGLLSLTLLLLDYFGRSTNLELFSMVNIISTLAAAGPWLAGWSRDETGSFVLFLLLLLGGVGALFLAMLAMRPPSRNGIRVEAIAQAPAEIG